MVRIALYQMADRGSWRENINAACRAIEACKADFICLPELFAVPITVKDIFYAWVISVEALSALKLASMRSSSYVIAGSLIERTLDAYYNTCYVLRRGHVIGKYRKMRPTESELKAGIKPGSEPLLIKSEHGVIGVLICADILHEDVVERVASKCDILFLPISISNPRHPKVEGHPVSSRVACKYGIVVAKVARIGVINGFKVGSKSAIVTPSSIHEASSDLDEELLEAEVHL